LEDTPETNQQRQSFQDLWNQALEGALEPPKPPERSIKYVQRHVSIKEFSKGESLGVGNFSEIFIATHKETGERFALKVIEKKQAAELAKRQHPNVYNEIHMERRVLLERLEPHPNIVRMYHAFQDYNSLYYLMELHVEWSDLWSELRYTTNVNGRETKFMVGCHRTQAKQWMLELVDALEHMHRFGIVHRDLKPENILLDKHGHVIVIDFGTAKDLVKVDLNGPEFVGTPEFMCPEAVTGCSTEEETRENLAKGDEGAVHTADLWAVGAILFVLETGMTPFWSASPYLTFLKIKRCLLLRPAGILDDDTWDLISSLMQEDPKDRLGATAFRVVTGKAGIRSIEAHGGYDCIRKHPYFSSLEPDCRDRTPVPSLRDLCYRPVAELAYQDSLDVDLCDQHPPGDKSSHDMMRLDPRDRTAAMYVLDRMKRLAEPRVYARFFTDSVACRLDKVRPRTRDFIGLTQMNDDQGKAPRALMNDPYSSPVAVGDIEIVYLTNPLLVQNLNETCDEDTRKQWIKLFKRSVATVNRRRPRLVVSAGYVDEKCRKLLARISETIPVVVHDRSAFFSFWLMGVQCIALQSSQVQEDSHQTAWLREQLEIVRMSKHPLFVFADMDPLSLPKVTLKRLARGRTLALFGVTKKMPYQQVVKYEANETCDDGSIRSSSSEEDENDEFAMKVFGTSENGLRWIKVDEEPDSWKETFEKIDN
jgi:3-phosphoinositide dependent protein kinase-1